MGNTQMIYNIMKYFTILIFAYGCSNSPKSINSTSNSDSIKFEELINDSLKNNIDTFSKVFPNNNSSKILKLFMEKFKYKEYKKNKIGSIAIIELDDSIITLGENKDYYFEQKNKKNSAFIEIKQFYKNEQMSLQCSRYSFNGFSNIGIYKWYDEKGNLVDSIDFDRNFEFSLDDLAKLIESKYELDIFNIENHFRLKRTINPNNYIISFPKDELKGYRYELVISGDNGEIISTELKGIKE